MQKLLLFSCFFLLTISLFSQEEDKLYTVSKSLSDKYKFSNIKAIDEDASGGVVIVRAYYGGMIMRLKGYYIEHYNKDLELVNEYDYAVDDVEIQGVFIADDRITVLEVNYDKIRKAYVYWANSTSLSHFNFKRTQLFHFIREKEKRVNFLKNPDPPFEDKFYSQLLFDSNKKVFTIITDSKKKGRDVQLIHLFDTQLNNKGEYFLEKETENRHLVFENIEYDQGKDALYLLGKAYEKGKRTKAISLKYAYQIFRLQQEEMTVTQFDTQDRYASSLKLLLYDDELKCVGFYSNRSDNRYRGLVYTTLDKSSLEVKKQKYNPFSEQFMVDKYGAEVEKELSNLTFKDIYQTEDGAVIFNAEERYMKSNYKSTAGDSRKKVNRYHFNDIVCAKLNSEGNMEWARNINKAESTTGDQAYVSYTSVFGSNKNCFFINSGAIPQKISKNRILFKKGYSKIPNVYMIDINSKGEMTYKEVVNSKDFRFPVMVSKGIVSNNQVYFLARRGNKKQILKIPF
ncbi:hypothetical protein GTQ40_12375 [Flavobacteriaceae bacterium R38]|nr:hypothetical protein [Flavobacteriaceae bacterium R38]